VRRIDVKSAQQMRDAVMAAVPGQHIFVGVAAVADWHVANVSTQKMKKQDGGSPPELKFEQNPDILATVAATTSLSGWPYCVGFAAESENLLDYGAVKREKKGIPLLVGNIGHHTFGQDENSIVLFDETGHTVLPTAPKLVLARQLVSEIAKRLEQRSLLT
jgi:phosphopantothenoylcysteine decarboxylase/phosphopantothenate--cysteine ligase